jgi:hypothetical protein
LRPALHTQLLWAAAVLLALISIQATVVKVAIQYLVVLHHQAAAAVLGNKARVQMSLEMVVLAAVATIHHLLEQEPQDKEIMVVQAAARV